MIFNLSQGGVADISVTAPVGATITAECEGLTLTGTGTCIIQAPIIGTWSLTCVYDSITKTDTVTVEAYGQTYGVSFDYSSVIRVTTHPDAEVTAEKSGETDVTGTADSSGICELHIPYDALGTWSVTADNGEITETKSVTLTDTNSTVDVGLLTNIPVITFVIDGDTYTFKGDTLDEEDKVKVTASGTSSFKLWLKTTSTFTFNFLKTNVDVCLIGKGGNGGGYKGNNPEIGGGGASGGEIKNELAYSFTEGVAYTGVVDSSGTSITADNVIVLSAVSGNNGGNGISGGNGGASVGGSGKGGRLYNG